MVINTMHFGDVEISEDSILHFDEGMVGFENIKRYVVLDSANADTSLKWLQSVDEPHTAFPIMNPFEAKNDYEIEVDDVTKNALNINDTSEVAVCSVVTVPNKVTRMTTNLKSPIIINLTNNKGRQVIMHNSPYNTQHFVLDEILSGVFGSTSNPDNK